MPTICIGKYSLEEAKQIRQAYRAEYGNDIRVRFRGRGRRRFYDNEGNWHNYSHSLPLRYAEKVAIYIDIDMNIRRENDRIRVEEEVNRRRRELYAQRRIDRRRAELDRQFPVDKVIRKFGIATFMEKLNASV